jgi:hypothetical protein
MNLDPQVSVALIAFLGAVIPVVMTRLLERRKNKADERRADYQDTQDDLASTRLELRALRSESGRQINELRIMCTSLDNEVVLLRSDVTTGAVPPLKPRPLPPATPAQARN